MKLVKLYSNFPRKFRTVLFRDGLNVVLASSTDPSSKDKDVHNLGKSLFAQVIDFCLLKGKDPDFFLIKYPQFKEFVFLLEIKTHRGELLTVRRSVKEPTKASFKKHSKADQDFSELVQQEWDHWLLPFDASKKLLDGILGLTVLSPWSYRQAVSYSLRSQKDFDEPFKLAKFVGSHSEWKPFLSHILGFNGEVVAEGYKLEEDLSRLQGEEKQLIALAGGIENVDQLRGQIQIAENDVRLIEKEMERFDFSPADERETRALVSEIDTDIVRLNEERYALLSDKSRIDMSLGVQLSINLKALERLFKESQVYFSQQVIKDYKALEEFNKELAVERDEYLRIDLEEIDKRLATLSVEIDALNAQRSSAIAFLTDAASLSKYRNMTKQLVGKQADLETLRRLTDVLDRLSSKQAEVRFKKAELDKVRAILDAQIQKPPARYDAIRSYFDEIVYAIISQHANLFSRINKESHLEFEVDILSQRSQPSSAAEGFSYGRLLCIAFDLAIMRAYIEEPFPHFVYHDGFLETLDDRKKMMLIEVCREYCRLGIQHIVTAIESELPILSNGTRFHFEKGEVILSLNDGGDSGRLFKMPSW